MTTGKSPVPAGKDEQGYRFVKDKFRHAGLTPQDSELVGVPRIEECPIQMECRVVAAHPFGIPEDITKAFHVEILRTHVEEKLIIPGTHYVDPDKWDPLIMKFCEFYGGGHNV